MLSEKCIMCCFDFKPGTLVEGKCELCVVKYPGVTSMKEWREKQNPEAKETEKKINKRVEEIVTRTLTEMGLLVDCPCGKAFYRKSPAQRYCGKPECDGKEKEKETA